MEGTKTLVELVGQREDSTPPSRFKRTAIVSPRTRTFRHANLVGDCGETTAFSRPRTHALANRERFTPERFDTELIVRMTPLRRAHTFATLIEGREGDA